MKLNRTLAAWLTAAAALVLVLAATGWWRPIARVLLMWIDAAAGAGAGEPR